MDALQHWLDLIVSAVGAFVAAVMGVAMRHAHKAQRGEPINWQRVKWDAPTVFVMGLAGATLGQYLQAKFGVPELAQGVIASSLGYLGPSAVDRALSYFERKGE